MENVSLQKCLIETALTTPWVVLTKHFQHKFHPKNMDFSKGFSRWENENTGLSPLVVKQRCY